MPVYSLRRRGDRRRGTRERPRNEGSLEAREAETRVERERERATHRERKRERHVHTRVRRGEGVPLTVYRGTQAEREGRVTSCHSDYRLQSTLYCTRIMPNSLALYTSALS